MALGGKEHGNYGPLCYSICGPTLSRWLPQASHSVSKLQFPHLKISEKAVYIYIYIYIFFLPRMEIPDSANEGSDWMMVFLIRNIL